MTDNIAETESKFEIPKCLSTAAYKPFLILLIGNGVEGQYVWNLIMATACMKGDTEVVEFLLKLPANRLPPGQVILNDEGLAHSVSYKHSFQITKLLLDSKANVHVTPPGEREGFPLRQALCEALPETIELLLKYGANVKHIPDEYFPDFPAQPIPQHIPDGPFRDFPIAPSPEFLANSFKSILVLLRAGASIKILNSRFVQQFMAIEDVAGDITVDHMSRFSWVKAMMIACGHTCPFRERDYVRFSQQASQPDDCFQPHWKLQGTLESCIAEVILPSCCKDLCVLIADYV